MEFDYYDFFLRLDSGYFESHGVESGWFKATPILEYLDYAYSGANTALIRYVGRGNYKIIPNDTVGANPYYLNRRGIMELLLKCKKPSLNGFLHVLACRLSLFSNTEIIDFLANEDRTEFSNNHVRAKTV